MKRKQGKRPDAEAEGCTVFIFPLSWRTGTARRVAEAYLSKTPKARARYWKETLEINERELARIGCATDDVDREQDGFKRAVQAAIDAIQGRTPEPDGAA